MSALQGTRVVELAKKVHDFDLALFDIGDELPSLRCACGKVE